MEIRRTSPDREATDATTRGRAQGGGGAATSQGMALAAAGRLTSALRRSGAGAERMRLLDQYLFHVHARAPDWRLVLRKGAPPPDRYDPGDWEFTRERTAEDTNPDVRRACEETGYCLFRIGGTFDDLAADLERRRPVA